MIGTCTLHGPVNHCSPHLSATGTPHPFSSQTFTTPAHAQSSKTNVSGDQFEIIAHSTFIGQGKEHKTSLMWTIKRDLQRPGDNEGRVCRWKTAGHGRRCLRLFLSVTSQITTWNATWSKIREHLSSFKKSRCKHGEEGKLRNTRRKNVQCTFYMACLPTDQIRGKFDGSG